MRFILGIEYIVTMKPDAKVGVWQKLEDAEDGTQLLSSGPATINASEVLLIRPSLTQIPVSEAQANAWRESWRGLPDWTRTDIALDLDIHGRDVEDIHVFRCEGKGAAQ